MYSMATSPTPNTFHTMHRLISSYATLLRNIASSLLATLLILTMTGCNGDIFLDEPDMPEDQCITIEGDGGVATVKIPTKELEYLGLDLMSMSKRYCHYYNAAGEEIDSKSPASEVARILFETKFTKLELTRHGSELTVRSICRASQGNDIYDIRLEYSYAVHFIHVEILPGKPIQLVDVIYRDDMEVSDRAKVTSFREGFHNQGPLPQTVTLLPYLNELATILVEPEYHESWLRGERFDMPVPMYVDGEWRMIQKDGICPGTKYSYEGPDRMTKIDVTVPEFSSVNIFTDVTYSGARVSGQMVFRNEILDLTFFEDITVTSYYPVKHEIRVEDAK